jgi:hypothetical protein
MCPPWSCISIKHSPAEPPGKTLIGKTSPRQGPPDPKPKPPLLLLLLLSIRPYCGRNTASNSNKLLLEFGSRDRVMLMATRPPGSCNAAAATLAGCCSGSCRQQECERQTPAAAWHSTVFSTCLVVSVQVLHSTLNRTVAQVVLAAGLPSVGGVLV